MDTTESEKEPGLVRVMPDELADQIAAGEVVERPASAVKELVENALDAGATRISIELEEGGLHLIRVRDDGKGMSREDAQRCILRHATSKLLHPSDLFRIQTLGFRGEAIPSIASVSRFSIVTRRAEDLIGTRVVVQGGHLQEVVDAGAPVGTEVTVRDLFFNTPARLKFLRTRSTEQRQVVEMTQRLALAWPQVGFTLSSEKRTILDLPPVERASDRIFSIVTKEEARGLFPLEPAEQDGVICRGYFSKPTVSRSSNAGIWVFVNGRFIRDKTIVSAIRNAYEGMVDRGRHPIVILNLEVPHSLVDVNVHPAKTEVRFSDSSSVFRAVRRSIANSLAAAPWVDQELGQPTTMRVPWRPGTEDAADQEGGWSAQGQASLADLPQQSSIPVRSYTLHGPSWASETRTLDLRREEPWAEFPTTSIPLRQPQEEGEVTPAPGYFESLHYVGCIHRNYLLASDRAGLVVVDQHAAHERITYERLRLAWRDRRHTTASLLIPRMISLDSVRAETLHENLEFFETLGFEIEPFGGDDFAIKAAPVVLKDAQHEPLLLDALDELGESGHTARVDAAIDAVLIRMACHGSIRAGDSLRAEEVYQLYRELDQVDFGANCPHGRPVYFRITLEELETRFERR